MLVSRTWQNYKQTITRTILERRIQKLLTSDDAQKQFLYHRKLIYLIADLFGDLDSALVESVTMIHFLQFQYLYFMVNYIALPMTVNSRDEARKVLHPIEEKTKEIASYITSDQAAITDAVCDAYASLNEHIEIYQTACSINVDVDRDFYEELVKPLAAVFTLPVEIFNEISGNDKENEKLQSGLEYYFLGKKIITDIIDFKYDVTRDSWNYVQSSFSSRMQRENIQIDQMDAEKRGKYFFVSGVATERYLDAVYYFEKSINYLDSLSSDKLKLFPQQDIRQIRQILKTIDQLLIKAANKVGPVKA